MEEYIVISLLPHDSPWLKNGYNIYLEKCEMKFPFI